LRALRVGEFVPQFRDGHHRSARHLRHRARDADEARLQHFPAGSEASFLPRRNIHEDIVPKFFRHIAPGHVISLCRRRGPAASLCRRARLRQGRAARRAIACGEP